MSERDDMVWIPAVPLPLIGLGVDQCYCGARFWFRHRERYELHFRRKHENEERVHQGPKVRVSRDEAHRIYEAVKS